MRVSRPVALLCWLAAAAIAPAGAAPLPFESGKQHVGVASCAGSNCHGAAKPVDRSPVLQNEYFVWESKDAHSNAYRLLLSPQGKRIAANLGLKAAHEARECLVCHTNYAEPAQRGRRYQLTEGVSCEACHGPAQDWLGPHVSGKATHADNVAAGLYPLEDPAARAQLCLHCHLGSEARPIDHRIMGAGHPPLAFELDTFTVIQPAHFRLDADYGRRKPVAPGAKTWAVGQLVAAQFVLDGLLSPRFSQDGVFPELVFFDCNACHHPMKPPRWNPGLAGPLGPGEVRVADAALANAGHVLAVLLPARSAEWDRLLATLHLSTKVSAARLKDTAAAMRAIAVAATAQLAGRTLQKAEGLALLDRIARYALDQDSGDFTAAQQTSMALDAISAWLATAHGAGSPAFKSALDAVFASVDTRINYDPAAFRAAMAKARAAAAAMPR